MFKDWHKFTASDSDVVSTTIRAAAIFVEINLLNNFDKFNLKHFLYA